MNSQKMEQSLLLYGVTDEGVLPEGMSLEDAVEASLRGGITMLQYRDKHATKEQFLEKGQRLRELSRRYGIPLIVNDVVTLAPEIQADGVHMGQDDGNVAEVRRFLGEDLILGVTVHNVEQALEAEAQGADYLGVGAAFGSTTKLDVGTISYDEYREITRAVKIPVCAIGGIHEGNVQELQGCGIAGISVISGIYAREDVERATRALLGQARRYFPRRRTAVVTIAGSDSCGGAGMQADLKTFQAHGVYGMSALTAITAQNTREILQVQAVDPELLECQLQALRRDLPVDGVKIGMVPSLGQVKVLQTFLKELRQEQPELPVVLDPVMVSSSGTVLLPEETRRAMEDMLLPLVTLVTPNVPEAVQMYQDAFLGAQPKLDLANLISEVARDEAALQALGRKLSQKWQVAILLKGGHRVVGHGEDVLFVGEEMRAFPMHGEQEATRNLHGTGCTLSSAIAANLAKGETLEKSVEFGKAYMDEIWNQGITLSSGAQLLWHARKNA